MVFPFTRISAGMKNRPMAYSGIFFSSKSRQASPPDSGPTMCQLFHKFQLKADGASGCSSTRTDAFGAFTFKVVSIKPSGAVKHSSSPQFSVLICFRS